MKVFSFSSLDNSFELEVFKYSDVFSEKIEIFLSKSELDFCSAIENPTRKKQYIQSRYQLKKRLSACLDIPAAEIEFQLIGEGKPVLKHKLKKIDFNLSHTENYFVVATSMSGVIGVDIENIRRPTRFEQVMNKVFTPDEVNSVLSLTESEAQVRLFTKIWSAKEALIKAAAGGVFKHSHDIQINGLGGSIEKLPMSFGPPIDWQLLFFENIEKHILSIAFRNSI